MQNGQYKIEDLENRGLQNAVCELVDTLAALSGNYPRHSLEYWPGRTALDVREALCANEKRATVMADVRLCVDELTQALSAVEGW